MRSCDFVFHLGFHVELLGCRSGIHMEGVLFLFAALRAVGWDFCGYMLDLLECSFCISCCNHCGARIHQNASLLLLAAGFGAVGRDGYVLRELGSR